MDFKIPEGLTQEEKLRYCVAARRRLIDLNNGKVNDLDYPVWHHNTCIPMLAQIEEQVSIASRDILRADKNGLQVRPRGEKLDIINALENDETYDSMIEDNNPEIKAKR